jgi:hypothetical protein
MICGRVAELGRTANVDLLSIRLSADEMTIGPLRACRGTVATSFRSDRTVNFALAPPKPTAVAPAGPLP